MLAIEERLIHRVAEIVITLRQGLTFTPHHVYTEPQIAATKIQINGIETC